MDHAVLNAESKTILAGGPAAFVTPATSTGCARRTHRRSQRSTGVGMFSRTPTLDVSFQLPRDLGFSEES